MNQIIHLTQSSPVTIIAKNIKEGTYFYGTLNSYTINKLFLRVYTQIVLVEDPSSTWSLDIPVTSYLPVEVTVKVERFI